jgi:hypothetical protein
MSWLELSHSNWLSYLHPHAKTSPFFPNYFSWEPLPP